MQLELHMQPILFSKPYKFIAPRLKISDYAGFDTLTFTPVSPKITKIIAPQKTSFFNKKRFLKYFGIFSFVLPVGYFFGHYSHLQASNFTLPEEPAVEITEPLVQVPAPLNHDLNSIQQQKVLTVATVADNSLYFGEDGYEHGFGVDVVRAYAHHLGVKLNTLVLSDESEALNAVSTGQADIALTNLNFDENNDLSVNHVSLSCGKDYLTAQGLNEQISLQIPKSSTALHQSANDFLCNKSVISTNKRLAEFYSQNAIDAYSERKFNQAMKTALPTYQETFQNHAEQHDLDWELLVAIGYQESRLDPEAISPTGVRGIMMLTTDTATEMGITDRINPAQSIHGGAKYFNAMQKMFRNVPESDRMWFALAAYNMGPQAVKNVQAKLSNQGKNSNSWAEVYRYLSDNQADNPRYLQCIRYVTNIRSFLETLKQRQSPKNETLVAQKIA